MSLREFILWKDETCANCWYKWQSVMWIWKYTECISCNNSSNNQSNFNSNIPYIESLIFEWDNKK